MSKAISPRPRVQENRVGMVQRRFTPRVVRWLGAVVFLVSQLYSFGFSGPIGTLTGGHTDHVAHVGETRLFPRLGLALWTTPVQALYRRLDPDELARLPTDLRAYVGAFPENVFAVPGYAPDRPLATNFAHVPRCYPPGVFLVGGPSALLYHFGFISFRTANLLFLLILAAAWLVTLHAWTASWIEVPALHARQLATAGLAAYLLYWTLEGFYDVVAIGAASLAVEWTRRGRLSPACLAWGVAVLVHSRLLALLPLAVLPFLATARSWSTLTRAQRWGCAGGALLYLGGLAFAVAIQPTVALHAVRQPPNVLRPDVGSLGISLSYAGVLGALSVLLWRSGSKADAALLLFAGAAFASQRYLAPWYWLLILPWVMVRLDAPGRSDRLPVIARATLTVAFFAAGLTSR